MRSNNRFDSDDIIRLKSLVVENKGEEIFAIIEKERSHQKRAEIIAFIVRVATIEDNDGILEELRLKLKKANAPSDTFGIQDHMAGLIDAAHGLELAQQDFEMKAARLAKSNIQQSALFELESYIKKKYELSGDDCHWILPRIVFWSIQSRSIAPSIGWDLYVSQRQSISDEDLLATLATMLLRKDFSPYLPLIEEHYKRFRDGNAADPANTSCRNSFEYFMAEIEMALENLKKT